MAFEYVLYDEEFVSTTSISFTHSLNRKDYTVTVLVSGVARNDLISSLTCNATSVSITLSSTQSGTVLLIKDDYAGATFSGSSSFSMTTGVTEIDFGSTNSNLTEVDVTGQSSIISSNKINVYIKSDDTTVDHNATEHMVANNLASFSAGDIIDGVGFTIYGVSQSGLTGKFKVRWSWY